MIKSLLGILHLILLPELTFLVPVPFPYDGYLLKQSALNSKSTLFPAEKKEKTVLVPSLGCTRTEVRFFCISEKQCIGCMVFPYLPPLKIVW